MDPDKYSKNRNVSPDNLFKTLLDLSKFGLMILGLVGVGFEFFKEGGWLKTALAKLFESTTTMLFIPVIFVALWLLNNMMSSKNPDQKNTSGDLPMYLMMLLGAYYLFQFITTGSM